MMELPIDQLAAQDAAALDPNALLDPAAMQAAQEAEQARRAERLNLFGERLDKLFRQQVADKSLLEERWLKDLRQYAGEYEEDVLARIREAGGSEAYLNLTRVKCNATEARLSEMLLPTDDRNWAVEPTPVPTLELAMRDRQLARGPDGQPVVGPDGQPMTVGDQIAEKRSEAKKRAELMQTYMDDQLAECGYNAMLRDVIHNMVVLGTGVLKGPVIRNRMSKRFSQAQSVDPITGMPVQAWQIEITEDLAPGAESVSPWDFFPDMRATRMDECEFVFERHRFNKAQLRELAKLPGFIPEQINELLRSEPDTAYSGMFDLTASSDRTNVTKTGYEVLEYHGAIDKEDLIAAGVEVDPDDELTSYQGTVWFCNRKVIKATLSMLDSGELMYDVVPMERDNSMLFGYGIPFVMRHTQRSANAAWRMILDNARLSVGGQVLWKQGKVRPVNGDYRLTSLKGWEVVDPNSAIGDVFGVVPIVANFQGMFAILETARQFTDEETGLPMIAQGQQSPSITKTAQGMSILMNSANTVLRRLVKEFDDQITSRFIRRLYHWNMQYGEDETAKGDYQVIALGSSSLLIREQQTQGLMALAQLGATNPEFLRRTKWGDLYRKVVQSMNINADGLVKTEEEIAFEQQQAAQQQPQQPPPEMQIEMAKLELEKAKLQMSQAEAQAELQIKQAQAAAEQAEAQARTETERQKVQATFEAERMRAMAAVEAARADMARVQVDRELALLKLAAEREMTLEQVRAEFGIKAMELDSKHQLFNAERAVKQTMGSGL